MENLENIRLSQPVSKFQAIIQGRCPRCREGKMFEYPASKISEFDKMHKNCPVCDLRFEVEPGFWFGAMFISYGFTVIVLAVLGVATNLLFPDASVWAYIIPITVVSLGLVPFNFRLSRSVFIHFFGFIPYQPRVKI
jgi:uncharacterized protein (DUF983 family)